MPGTIDPDDDQTEEVPDGSEDPECPDCGCLLDEDGTCPLCDNDDDLDDDDDGYDECE